MSDKSLIAFVFLFFSLTSCLSFPEITPKPHSLEYNKSFDLLAQDITAQGFIFELDDFTRHHKSVNGISVYLGAVPDSMNIPVQGSGLAYEPLNKVLDSFDIDNALLEDFQVRLRETKLRSFVRSGDSVLFIVDGFLNDAWGLMYSKKGLRAAGESFNFCGNDVTSIKLINRNWSRVSIH